MESADLGESSGARSLDRAHRVDVTIAEPLDGPSPRCAFHAIIGAGGKHE
jgi:hypothetical protein